MTQFPFSAVVAMDDMRLALMLNAISPAIGGVLVRGEKGTAKSTAVRALTAVLPPVEVVAGCRFSCSPAAPDPECPDGPHPDGPHPDGPHPDGPHPDGPHPAGPYPAGPATELRQARLVELPVGATEDRLTGSLDVGRALTEGLTLFQPGLLAAAHRGVLYVDEVNLLHDHLVDLLLDAAALGTSYVERDGVSVRHAARFLLVGTMNPEEGELRPQLLDRFGLTVEASAPRAPATRAEVVRRRLDFDADPAAFAARFAASEAALAADIAAARSRLPGVVLDDAALELIAAVCASFDVDGLRADIVIARTAAAHAAWQGRDAVTRADIRVAALLALPHRRRRNPFDAPGLDEQQLDDALGDEPAPDGEPDPPPPPGDGPPQPDDGKTPARDPASAAPEPGDHEAGDQEAGDQEQVPARAAGRESVVAAGATFRARRLEVPGKGRGAAGRRSRAYTDSGATVGVRQRRQPVRDLHVHATLLASAPHQVSRGRSGPGLLLESGDLRERRREGRESNLVLFVVDASGSMAARRRMEAVKGAVLSLLLDAYQRRDKVGLISFRGTGAELLLPPTSSADAAARRLENMPTGGRTPLAAGLTTAYATLRREKLRDPLRRPLLVLVTDGRHNAGGEPAGAAGLLRRDGVAAIVVDCEAGPVRLGLAGGLARALGADCVHVESLSAEGAQAGSQAGARAAGQADARRIAGGLADSVRAYREVA